MHAIIVSHSDNILYVIYKAFKKVFYCKSTYTLKENNQQHWKVVAKKSTLITTFYIYYFSFKESFSGSANALLILLLFNNQKFKTLNE